MKVALGSGLLVAAAGVASAVPAVPRTVPQPVHGQVVPDTPRTGWPKILDGEITSTDRVGQYLVVGGSFTEVVLPDGSHVSQPYLAAFDIDSGAFSTSFRPALDNKVQVIEAGDTPGTVFVGGRFKNANGVYVGRMVKLDVLTGAVVSTFSAPFDAEIDTIARTGDRLFVGGEFSKVRNVSATKIAEISATTGKPNAAFGAAITGSRASGCRLDGFCYTYTGPMVRSLRLTPDGKKLIVMHRADLVGGQRRWGAAVLDVSGTTAVVTPWQSNLWDQSQNGGRTDFVGVIEGDISPNGSQFVMSLGLGNLPPLHDTTVSFPTSAASPVQPMWVTQNFDSTYGIAVSDQATYQGGHFCWTESQQSVASPMYWPGAADNSYSCYGWGGGWWQPQTIYRDHLSAMDLPTGRALAWDPTSSDSFRGVLFLRTVDRGLALGHDGNRIKQLNVGRFAFFDLGMAYEPREKAAPTIAITSPTAGQTVQLTTVNGNAKDDYRLKKIDVRLRDVATGQWIQANGTKGSTPYLWSAAMSAEQLPGQSRTWSISTLPSPVGSVEIQARSIDLAGKYSAWVTVKVTGSAAAQPVAAQRLAEPFVGAEPNVSPVADSPDDVAVLSPWRWEGFGAQSVAQAPDGTVLRVTPNGAIERRTDSMTWAPAAEFGNGWDGPLAAQSASQIVGNNAGAVHRRGNGQDNAVHPMPAASVSVGADGTVGVVEGQSGSLVFVENGTVVRDATARSVAVQSLGVYWKVGRTGELLRGRPGQWTKIADGVASVAVGADGQAAVILADGRVARVLPDNRVQAVDGLPVRAASVAVQKGIVYVTGEDANVYRLTDGTEHPVGE